MQSLSVMGLRAVVAARGLFLFRAKLLDVRLNVARSPSKMFADHHAAQLIHAVEISHAVNAHTQQPRDLEIFEEQFA